VLGWEPQHRFEEGLGELVQWFQEEAS
jgi:nucleoside-diphosphate-sugar epimerase